MTHSLAKRYRFSAAHTLRSPRLSSEENQRVFGKCAHASGHGHDYVVEIVVSSPALHDDVVWGHGLLDDVMAREVTARLAYSNLNTAFGDEFIPTGENLARMVYDLVVPHLAAPLRLEVRLIETEKNAFLYSGPAAGQV